MQPLPTFEVISEVLAHKRFLKVWHRLVKFPDGRQLDWDSVGVETRGPHFTVIFPFFSKSAKVRIIREYCQGINELRFSLPSGGLDLKKHGSIYDCARDELGEEAHLKGGELIALVEVEGNEGIPELKWSRNRFIPFLCLDPEQDLHPPPQDDEELVTYQDVTVPEFRQLCLNGEMMLTAVQTGLMALHKLGL